MDVEKIAGAGRARPAAGPCGQLRRRPAGAPPRHHRRLDRPRRLRRPTCRPPRSRSAPPTWCRARTAPARSPPPTSTRASSSPALAPDEMLTEIRVPKMHGAGWSFQKFNRRAQDWAIVGVAAWRRNGDSGVALVNMGSTPDPRHQRVGGPRPAARRSAMPPSWPPPRPSRRTTSTPARSTASHLAKVLVRRALEEASA